MSGDTQIRTLVRTPNVYFDQLALRILSCDVKTHILRSKFVHVVVLWYALCFTLHTSCQLPLSHIRTALIQCLSLLSFHDSCTVIYIVQYSRYNWQLTPNSIICLACFVSKQYRADSYDYIEYQYPYMHCVCTVIDQKINVDRLRSSLSCDSKTDSK